MPPNVNRTFFQPARRECRCGIGQLGVVYSFGDGLSGSRERLSSPCRREKMTSGWCLTPPRAVSTILFGYRASPSPPSILILARWSLAPGWEASIFLNFPLHSSLQELCPADALLCTWRSTLQKEGSLASSCVEHSPMIRLLVPIASELVSLSWHSC